MEGKWNMEGRVWLGCDKERDKDQLEDATPSSRIELLYYITDSN